MADYDASGPGGMSDSDAAPTKVSSPASNSRSSPAPKKKTSKARDAISSAGQSLNERSVDELREISRDAANRIESFKRGGTKRGAGVAKLHKKERIMAPKRGKKRKMGRSGGRA